jgi:hypothetical protein
MNGREQKRVKFLVVISEQKKPLERPWNRWKDNIKTNLNEWRLRAGVG